SPRTPCPSTTPFRSRDLVGGVPVLPGQAVEKLALDRLARRVGDRVDQDVEPVPALAELLEAGGDLVVAGHVEGQHDIAAKRGGGLLDTRAQLVIEVGECHLGTLAVHGLGDAAGDRAVAGDAGDECALALQETHDCSSMLVAAGQGRQSASLTTRCGHDVPGGTRGGVQSSPAARPAWTWVGDPLTVDSAPSARAIAGCVSASGASSTTSAA